jgi:very-short-patch-repair endonuclease
MRLPNLTAWFFAGPEARESTTRLWVAMLIALAEAQHGVVARWQLVARGIPESQIDEWVKSKRMHIWHRGVYSVGHRVLGAHGRRKAAELAGGEEAALCLQTAGDFLDVKPNASGLIHIWVPNQRGRKLDPIRPHQFTDMLEEDIEVVDGIRTTNAMRVLVDMAPHWDVKTLERAFGKTELNRQFDLHTLNAILARRPNRPGIRNIRHVMEIYDGPVPDMTALEERGLWLVRKAGLPLPVAQHRTTVGRVDFYWRERALIMEMDSIRWHLVRQRWQNDLDRNNEHLEDGIATCRFTWERARQPESIVRLRRIYNNRPFVLSRA